MGLLQRRDPMDAVGKRTVCQLKAIKAALGQTCKLRIWDGFIALKKKKKKVTLSSNSES